MDGQLQSLRRQHHALLPPYLLQLPAPSVLASTPAQSYLVEHILHDPTLQGKSAERGYERTFWRKVVGELEKGVQELQSSDSDSEAEVDERIYEYLAQVMVAEPDASGIPKKSNRTFIYDHPSWSTSKGEGRVTLLEEQVAIQAGTTGLRTWTAALHLAHHIIHTPSILSPGAASTSLPPCIELGAGTGFLSILLAQLGADVISTDLEVGGAERQAPLDRLKANVALNDNATLRVEALDWFDSFRPLDEQPPIWHEITQQHSPRNVIAADVIYDPEIVPALVSTINTLLSPTSSTSRTSPSPTAIIAATVRNPTTLDLFTSTCQSSNLHIELLDLAPMDRSSPTFWDSALDHGSQVRIMRISRQSI